MEPRSEPTNTVWSFSYATGMETDPAQAVQAYYR